MSITQRISRGDGSVSAMLKRTACRILECHIPAGGLARPFFSCCYWLHVSMREGLGWALRFVWFEPLFRSQCERIGRRFRMEQLPYLTGHGEIVIGDGVRLSGKSSFTFNNRNHERPQIIIGNNTFIGHGCAFIAGRTVRIGTDCLIAGGVRISDQDGHPIDAERRRAGEPTPIDRILPVQLGNDVWIGEGAVILKGVRIGDRAVVGARSVVSKDVDPDTVVAGNPAHVVKRLPSSPEDNTRAEMFLQKETD